MSIREVTLARVFWMSALALFLTVVGVGVAPLDVMAQDSLCPDCIPAARAFDSPACSDSDLDHSKSLARLNPEWKVIILPADAGRPITDLPKFSPTILEGRVFTPPPACTNPPGVQLCEGPDDQMPSEVSEEDIPWNHYTHDFTFKIVPDPAYRHLLSSWMNPDGSTGVHEDMEVEWDNGSVMKVNDDDDRTWGAVPEFVWPAVGDRVWVEGRWIFDCGHPFPDDWAFSFDKSLVKFSTEIHPPRALVTFRLNHPALSDSPSRSTYPASWLPVTGETVPVPVTEADIFVSGNGGGANDLCMILPSTSSNDCLFGHTSPVIPVNDRNYVFDIYPPGTNYETRTSNGNFEVTPPSPDASLQWRLVDQSRELPVHATGVPTSIRSNLRRGSAAYNTRDAWAVDGAQSIAVSFTPLNNFSFGRADIALLYLVDLENPQPNEVQLTLETSDSSGLPSGTILDSWTLSNLPTYTGQLLTGKHCCPLQTVTPHQNVVLTAGVKYWLVATNMRADGSHHATFWAQNSVQETRDWASRCCDSGRPWIADTGGLPAPAFDIYAAAPSGATVDPIICRIDDQTPPPPRDQSNIGTDCPTPVPAQPTRLRVILPFAGSEANYFAKSLLLGWDVVPAGVRVRTFKVTLHSFTVVSNGKLFGSADWRVFVSVGGQHRYISPLWDRNPDGSNPCNGDDLTNNADGDCFLFDGTPWVVSVVDGTPIHVAIGGFVSEGIDSDFLGAPDNRWKYPNGDDPFGVIDLADLASNDDRIGPYQFDLNPPDYQWILPDGTIARPCDVHHQDGSQFTTNKTKDGENYKVEFCIEEILPSFPLATSSSRDLRPEARQGAARGGL